MMYSFAALTISTIRTAINTLVRYDLILCQALFKHGDTFVICNKVMHCNILLIWWELGLWTHALVNRVTLGYLIFFLPICHTLKDSFPVLRL